MLASDMAALSIHLMQKLVDYAERAFIVLIWAPFLVRMAVEFRTEPYLLALVASESLAVIFILMRRRGEISVKPFCVAIAFLGTALPLFASTGGRQIAPAWLCGILMFVGLGINISAKLALNRSFGLIAANRGVKRGGPYHVVRHPMYLGYITTQLGMLLNSFSGYMTVLYGTAWAMQILRILEEEKVLMRDAEYRAFAVQVPRRLFPGII